MQILKEDKGDAEEEQYRTKPSRYSSPVKYLHPYIPTASTLLLCKPFRSVVYIFQLQEYTWDTWYTLIVHVLKDETKRVLHSGTRGTLGTLSLCMP